MKSPSVAAVLSLVFPGAGLWYLGRWRLGFANLAAAIVLATGGTFAISLMPDSLSDVVPYLYLVIAAASAGLAHAQATSAVDE